MEILDLDLQATANTAAHHTDLYDTQKYVVLRWGNTFTFHVKLSEPFDIRTYSINANFGRGYGPRVVNGTKFVSKIGQYVRHYYYSWKAEMKSISDTEIAISVTLPNDGPIGVYDFWVEVEAERKVIHRMNATKQLVILFNPWDRDSSVYVESEDKREEYVINETGMIWGGTDRYKHIWYWNFAQLEEVCLEAALFLLDEKDLYTAERQNPIFVSRALAEMVNINDGDNGVLWGKWASSEAAYADGTNPTAWSGSEAILTEYMRTKQPVKYAQCWVFGGTLTTVLRALGIPARPITTFGSAHDTEANKTIDFYYDKYWNFLEDKSSDSIWNYHVWVDAWMTRPDLHGNYSGWQAVDATPQEISDYSGTMVTGPASVRAIKEGKDLKYDNLFVMAEVNADVLYHVEFNGKSIVIGSNTTRVGSLIATKKVGKDELEDITLEYKHEEGSLEERATASTRPTTDVKFTLSTEQSVPIGKPCTFTLTMKTVASENMTVDLVMKANSVTYTGSVGALLKEMKTSKTVNSSGEVTVKFTLSDKEYEGKLSGQAMLQCTVFANIKEKDQHWVGKTTQQFALPDLSFYFPSGSNNAKKAEPFSVFAFYDNPLNTTLTNIEWIVEGAGLMKPDIFRNTDSVAAGKKVEQKFILTPTESRRGRRTLVVTCNSAQLKGITGTVAIDVY
ncbi:protein-glutamine gamma-glutamyltransferase K-like [Dysidea avara]|uniref:protein-glutamine gamma-glutamyltransferase K-like n=1 Tax=Dysidea avara TaxID=196820 RepID=UPI0033313959